MKIIFLDIDGVLNSVRYDRQRTIDQGNIDETRLQLIKALVDETKALIVLSSSWRKHWEKDITKCDAIGREINEVFAKYQLAIYDKTELLPSNDRAQEIRIWLKLQGPRRALRCADTQQRYVHLCALPRRAGISRTLL